jgi:diaminopimelate epimerase
MGAPLAFRKYEGLGNDFIVVDVADERDVSPEQAAALCDRRFGVGADGVLLVLPARGPGLDARMRVINADGSIPEMCGNGVRCVAVDRARARGLERATIRVDTDAGERACEVNDAAGAGMVSVAMGAVRVLGERRVAIEGGAVDVIVADAGNPHAVLFGSFTRSDAERIGPRIATHADFPRGTNVEFARVDPSGIDLVVWERGVGITLACGTGACATVAVAVARGLVPAGEVVPVRLPGGRLDISVDREARATMRGPARHVFSGRLAGHERSP